MFEKENFQAEMVNKTTLKMFLFSPLPNLHK